nr:transcription factor PAR1-like [Ipomoea batatas]
MNAKCCRNSARKTTAKRKREHRDGGGGSVRMRVKKLQKLIPAGHGLPPERLFRETAEYILQLRLQMQEAYCCWLDPNTVEETVDCIELSYLWDSSLEDEVFQALTETVPRAEGLEIPSNKSITGELTTREEFCAKGGEGDPAGHRSHFFAHDLNLKGNEDVNFYSYSLTSELLKKSPPEELGAAGTSSELRSSKSTRGAAAAADLATPFGTLTDGPCEVDTAAATEPALLPL